MDFEFIDYTIDLEPQVIPTIDLDLTEVKLVYVQPNTEQVEIAPTIDLQTIQPSPDRFIDQVTVLPVTAEIDSQIVPTNIRAGVSILGVQGNLEPDKPDQTKTVTPSEIEQRVVADTGFELGMCVVAPIPSNYVGSAITRKGETTYTPTTTDQEIASGQYLSGKQVIKGDSNLTPENVAKGTTIFGVTGTHEGGITPEGTLYITINGKYDVADKAEVDVNVSVPTNPIDPPVFGFTTFKENGEYNAADYGVDGWSFVKVEVAGSGSENLDTELEAQDQAITELEEMANSLPNAGSGGDKDPNETYYEMKREDYLRQQMGMVGYADIPTEEEYLEQQPIVNGLIEKITGVAF